MQIFLTVVSGVFIYVMGQIIQTFILKPLQDFRIKKADISHKLKFHANNIIVPSIPKEVRVGWSAGDMRDLSSGLESTYLSIPFVDLFSYMKVIPNRNNVREATLNLMLLSNTAGQKGNEKEYVGFWV